MDYVSFSSCDLDYAAAAATAFRIKSKELGAYCIHFRVHDNSNWCVFYL